MDEWEDDEAGEDVWLQGLIKQLSCACQEESARTCSGCSHKQGCTFVDCNYSEHLELIELEKARASIFGRRQDCPCWSDDTEICDGCGHLWCCSAKQLAFCPDGVHPYESDAVSVELVEEQAEPCHCSSSKKHHCPACSHTELCEFREACSERWFHFPGAPLTEEAKPFDHLPVRDVEGSLPSKHKTLWSRPEDEQLVRLFGSGLDFAEIAAEHERTPGSITRRLAMLCFDQNGVLIKSEPIEAERANQAWTADDDELLTTLHVNKLGLTLLSSALKRSQRAVAIRLMHLRLVAPCDLDKVRYYSGAESGTIPNRNAGWTTPQYIEVREAFRHGASLVELAQISGRPEGSCLMVLYSRGEITVDDLQKALESAQAASPKG